MDNGAIFWPCLLHWTDQSYYFKVNSLKYNRRCSEFLSRARQKLLFFSVPAHTYCSIGLTPCEWKSSFHLSACLSLCLRAFFKTHTLYLVTRLRLAVLCVMCVCVCVHVVLVFKSQCKPTPSPGMTLSFHSHVHCLCRAAHTHVIEWHSETEPFLISTS